MTAGKAIGILMGAALVEFLILLGVLVLLDHLGMLGPGRWE